MDLWVIKRNEILIKKQDMITVEEIGQKARGLCLLPEAWTLPFFVISKNLFLDAFQKNFGENQFPDYIKQISLAIEELKLGENLIIRSSGEKEGMEERGKYESIICNRSEVKDKLLALINILKGYPELKNGGIPLIVQTYAGDEINGHLSNERRFAKENRDFIFEYRCSAGHQVISGEIHIRNWRKTYNVEVYKKQPLSGSGDFKDALSIISAFFYYQKKRVHIEYTCKGSNLYIVQCDYETPNSLAVNPENYNIQMFAGEIFEPRALRKIQEDDKGKYKKIDNIFVYKAVGERFPPLFILDDELILKSLADGNVPEGLEGDIRFMTRQSLIIRTNLICDDPLEEQLAQRSNELRDYEAAKRFLIETSKKLAGKRYIFIMHNFIPAKIAAFVNAKPMESIVEIQALWGLPEGLYYNAHDHITVNTKSIDVEKMDKAQFSIQKKEMYKENFIAPDTDGKWIVKKLKPPYDWNCTISNEETIKDIAFRARKITENVQKELSIMWFVEIDKNFYGVDNMPWYHEPYDRDNTQYITSKSHHQYKKKYFYEKEVVIESESDLEELQKMDNKEIGLVRIQPKNDELLRNRNFIKNVGAICKEKNITIFLEGAVLAHSYYQLLSTGVTILNPNEIHEYEEKIEFNKLVRDYIPDIIQNNGELVKWASIKGIGFVHEIKNKIVEEAYEVLGAASQEELIEELADLEEICMALEENINLLQDDTARKYKFSDDNESVALFECAVLEDIKQYQNLRLEEKEVLATLVRKKSNIQIDFLFGSAGSLSEKKKTDVCIDTEKKTILESALELLQTSDKKDCVQILQRIRHTRNILLSKTNYTFEEFNAVRINKAEKKGSFKKGYILFKTSLETRKTRKGLSSFLQETIETPMVIYGLHQSGRVDVDNLKGGRLLVRLSIPVYIRKEEWIIEREKINEYFHDCVKIRITKHILGTRIRCGISLLKESFRQLLIEFP